MKNPTIKRFAAFATVVAMFMAVPGIALAQTEPTETRTTQTERPESLDNLKRRALAAIEKRLEAIDRWKEQVANSEHLTGDHEAILETELDEAARGLSALATDIEAATSYSEIGGLIPKIVEDYWVFALLRPQVHLVMTADHMAVISDRFGEAGGSIQAAIDRAEEAGFEVGDAQASLDRMSAHLAAASLLIVPVPATVLAIQPADMPEAQEQLRSAHSDLKSAREELRSARQAAHEAVKALRDAFRT